MKIRILSDLHIEFSADYRPQVFEDDGDTVLVLAGDICEIHRRAIILPFMNEMAERFKHVVHVMGNHEYYNGHIPDSLKKLRELTSHLPNLSILDEEVVTIDGVNFIGTTLWTDMDRNDPLTLFFAGQQMRDYKKIRVGGYRKMRPIETVGMHAKSVMFLKRVLSDLHGQRNVVVTHHGPSHLSIHEKYRNDDLNGAYVSDLSELIFEHSPDLWLHGHVHSSLDYMLYDTRVICNPRGYPNATPENPEFAENKLIEL